MMVKTKQVTLQNLGPLSNPSIFRIYASLCLGALLGGYTIMIAYGHWAFVVVAFVGMASIWRALRNLVRYELPSAATVDGLNVLAGTIVAIIFGLGYVLVFENITAGATARVLVSALVAAGALVMAIAVGDGRAIKDPFRRHR